MVDLDSGKTLFDIFVNTDQIGMGFKADTPRKRSNMPIFSDFQTKIWLKSYWRATKFFGCSSITRFLSESSICKATKFFGCSSITRFLSESSICKACCCHFLGVSASNPMPIWPVLMEISKKSYLNRRVFSSCCFEVTWFSADVKEQSYLNLIRLPHNLI